MTHYLIDGYNWLFRYANSYGDDNLKGQREAVIHELSLKLSISGIKATLVFDSHFQPGGVERLRSKGILICYTEEGQTADDFILEFVKHVEKPQNYTVVTSDNYLAWGVRQKKGASLSVESFKKMLDRICIKKTKPAQEKRIPTSIKPQATLLSYYEKIFESQLEGKPPLKKKKGKSEDCQLISDHERWKRIFEGDGA